MLLRSCCFHSLRKRIENAYSDSAVVRVECRETACVTLMLPSLKRCIRLLHAALQLPRARVVITADVLRPAQEALARIATHLPTPIHEDELPHIKETTEFISSRAKAEETGLE